MRADGGSDKIHQISLEGTKIITVRLAKGSNWLLWALSRSIFNVIESEKTVLWSAELDFQNLTG
jgi:hypothetical protein